MPFAFRRLEDRNALLVEPRDFTDDRGWFAETYMRTDYENPGIPGEFRQDKRSTSTPNGVPRGLHFQFPPMRVDGAYSGAYRGNWP